MSGYFVFFKHSPKPRGDIKMKLNFFKLFGSEAYEATEMAEEIAKLEEAIPDFRKAADLAEAECVRIRRMKIGGGDFSEKELEAAQRQYDNTRLDLQAAKSSLHDLLTKLKEIVAADLEKEKQAAESDRQALKEEVSEWKEDVVRKAAALQASRVALGGGHAMPIYTFCENPQEEELFNRELSRLLKQHSHPTYFEKKRELYQRQERLRATTVKSAVENLLAEARKQQAVS